MSLSFACLIGSLWLALLCCYPGWSQTQLPVPGTIPGYNTAYTAISLPFNPSRLKGMQANTIWQHYREVYATEVRLYNQLRREQKSLSTQNRWSWNQKTLTVSNSLALHELYFHNLGGSGVSNGVAANLLHVHFGSEEAWRREVLNLAAVLPGETGWIVWVYHWESAQARLYALEHPVQQAWGGIPLVAIDLAPHAYEADFGKDRERYIQTFLSNLNWDKINQRLATIGVR